MSKSQDVFVYMGTYDTERAAKADLDEVKRLHREGVIGTYDAAVVAREDGKVHVRKIEKPTRRGGWTGLAAGAVVGLLFPPALVGTALAGAIGGGLLGHFARGMSRGDMKELGETLDSGQAALVVVGRDKLGEKIAKNARKEIERQVDISGEDLDRELEKAFARM